MAEATEERSKLGTVSLLAAAGLFLAAGLFSGPLSLAAAVLGGIALATGLATILAPGLGDGRALRAPRPQEAAPEPQAEPQQAVRLHVDAPASVRRWLERVEHEAEAAERSR